jgi:hypothetical protein
LPVSSGAFTFWFGTPTSDTHLKSKRESIIPTINLHLKAIYVEGELSEVATIKSYLRVQSKGGRSVSPKVKPLLATPGLSVLFELLVIVGLFLNRPLK